MGNLLGFISQVSAGLRFRLLLLVALACAPLVALTLHAAWEERRHQIESWQQRSQRMTQVASREEQELIGGTRQLLVALAESSSARSGNRRGCKHMLDELFGSYPRYANLGVLKTNGDILASSLPMLASENQARQQFFRRTLQTAAFTIGDFPVAHTNGRPTINFGYPIFDRSGQVQGVVFAALDLRWLGRFGSELPAQLPKGAVWTEINANGTILARHPAPESWVGKPLPEPALVGIALNHPPGVEEALDAQGIPTIYGFASRPSQLVPDKVMTILSIPRQALFAGADRALTRNLTWLGVAAGLALALGWIGSNLLVLRPVKSLVRTASRLATGDLSTRTNLPHGRDELGQLTLAFDQMAQALEQREQERQRARNKLQVLTHRLVEVQETERRHIARELHDEIGQSLTAAEINLQAALQLPGTAALGRRLAEKHRVGRTRP